MTHETLFDDFIDFAEELTELIKQDWENSKKFIKKHKKYFFWVIVLVLTMQITDIMRLGASWDKYCKLNGIQNGGDNAGAPAAAPAAPAAPSVVIPEAPSAKADTAADGKAVKTPKKNMLSRASKGLKDSIKNNPVLGNMDKIFDMVSGMFTLIIFILVVVGILSLPVVIFIVITYCILKSLLSRLAIL